VEINLNQLTEDLKKLEIVKRLTESEKERFGDISQEEISKYLNELRKSGVTNMFGATPYIEKEFGISKEDAKKALSYWMKNFKKDESKVNEMKKEDLKRALASLISSTEDSEKLKRVAAALDLKGDITIEESKINESDFDTQLKRYKKEAYDYYANHTQLVPTPEEILNYICDQVEDASGVEVDDATAKMYAKKLGLTLDEHCGHCAEDMKKKAKKVVKSVKKIK
jgi:hypothetical protein